MPLPPTLADVIAALDSLYDPRTAESWDAVGLVCGDPAAPVRHVHFAVDPVEAVAEEAIAAGADLLVTHHPLYLRGTSSVAATSPKGRLVHRLITAGVALHCIHTNADNANPGVSDALAAALGLSELRPLEPADADPQDKLVTFVPEAAAEAVLDALAHAGAGRIGAYERCAWTTTGTGTFRPMPGAHPTLGAIGDVERVSEVRLEMVLPRAKRAAVIAALREAHPYEEVAFDLIELASLPSDRGSGRIGTLPSPIPLRNFVERVAAALPATTAGVRASGDPSRLVQQVAVCGGAGDSFLAAAAAAGVDAFVTADLRHHPVSESAVPALIDPGHWASEWPWLNDASQRLIHKLSEGGTSVTTSISHLVTDPWTLHASSDQQPAQGGESVEGRA